MRSEKVVQLEGLFDKIVECKKCMIAQYARNRVFGDGNVSSPIMFIGEAPGMDEDACGHVFVGKAGQIYDRTLKAASLVRKEVFTANILKCHPPKEIDPVKGNRKPAVIEVINCLPFLKRQIEIIQPKVIVAMGETAARALLDLPKGRFGPFVGEIFKQGTDIVKFWEPKVTIGVTWHPQYIGYRGDDEALWSGYVRSFRKFKEIACGK